MENHENHEYQAPGPTDSRSPCPALNTLANHGYLPRDGKDITPKQFIEAIYKGYNLTKVLNFILAHGAFLILGKTWQGKISLEDLYADHAIEHPMSLTRPDRGFPDFKKISPELIDSLFSEKNKDGKLTKESFARQHIKRRGQSLRDNPNFKGLSFFHHRVVYGEYTLTLLCFPKSENERGKEIDVDTLRSIYQCERLPEGWKKAEQTVSLSQVTNLAGEIRKLIDDLDKEKKKNN